MFPVYWRSWASEDNVAWKGLLDSLLRKNVLEMLMSLKLLSYIYIYIYIYIYKSVFFTTLFQFFFSFSEISDLYWPSRFLYVFQLGYLTELQRQEIDFQFFFSEIWKLSINFGLLFFFEASVLCLEFTYFSGKQIFFEACACVSNYFDCNNFFPLCKSCKHVGNIFLV